MRHIIRTPVCEPHEREALESLPWEEVRPGTHCRTLHLSNCKLSQSRLVCQDCRTDDSLKLDYIVRPELWHEVCPQNGVLCYLCFEKRLGRPLSAVDLNQELPVYQIFYHILRRREMTCEVCGRGPQQGVTIYRVNPKGEDGIWRCETHLEERLVNPAVKDIEKNQNQGH